MKVFLIKKNKVISISKDKANDLIKNKEAREVESKDFLVKPKIGTTKAFGNAPNETSIRASTR